MGQDPILSPVDFVKSLAKANGIDESQADQYLKKYQGNHTMAAEAMLEANGKGAPRDWIRDVHAQKGLPYLDSEEINRGYLGPEQKASLEEERKNLFNDITTKTGVKDSPFGPLAQPLAPEEITQKQARMKEIRDRLQKADEISKYVPDFFKIEPTPIDGLSDGGARDRVAQLRKEAEQADQGYFGADSFLSQSDRNVIKGTAFAEEIKKEKLSKADAMEAALEKEKKEDPWVLTARTAMMNAKVSGGKEADHWVIAKKSMVDHLTKLDRMYTQQATEQAKNPTPEGKQRLEEIKTYQDQQYKEYARSYGLEAAAAKKRQEVFRQTNKMDAGELPDNPDQKFSGRMNLPGPKVMRNFGRAVGKSIQHSYDSFVIGADELIKQVFGREETYDEFLKHRAETEMRLAESTQGAEFSGAPITKTVEIGGKKYQVGEGNDIDYAIDDAGRPLDFTEEDQKNVDEYNANRDNYEIKRGLSVKKLVGTGTDVLINMMPIIAVNAATTVATGLLPGGQAKAIQSLASIATSFVSMYHENLRQAIEQGKGYQYAKNTANGKTFVQALIEQGGGLEARTGKKVGEKLRKALREAGDMKNYASAKVFRETLWQRAGKAIKDYASEAGEELAQDFTDVAWDNVRYGLENRMDWEKEFNMLLTLPFGTAPMGMAVNAYTTYADRREFRRDMVKAAADLDAAKKALDLSVEAGVIDQKEADIKYAALERSSQKIQEVQSDNLENKHKIELLNLIADQERNNIIADGSASKVIQDEYRERAEKLGEKFDLKYKQYRDAAKEAGTENPDPATDTDENPFGSKPISDEDFKTGENKVPGEPVTGTNEPAPGQTEPKTETPAPETPPGAGPTQPTATTTLVENLPTVGQTMTSDSGQKYTIRGITDKGGIQFTTPTGAKGVWSKDKFDEYVKDGRLKYDEDKTASTSQAPEKPMAAPISETPKGDEKVKFGDRVNYQGIHGFLVDKGDHVVVRPDRGPDVLVEGGKNQDVTWADRGVEPVTDYFAKGKVTLNGKTYDYIRSHKGPRGTIVSVTLRDSKGNLKTMRDLTVVKKIEGLKKYYEDEIEGRNAKQEPAIKATEGKRAAITTKVEAIEGRVEAVESKGEAASETEVSEGIKETKETVQEIDDEVKAIDAILEMYPGSTIQEIEKGKEKTDKQAIKEAIIQDTREARAAKKAARVAAAAERAKAKAEKRAGSWAARRKRLLDYFDIHPPGSVEDRVLVDYIESKEGLKIRISGVDAVGVVKKYIGRGQGEVNPVKNKEYKEFIRRGILKGLLDMKQGPRTPQERMGISLEDYVADSKFTDLYGEDTQQTSVEVVETLLLITELKGKNEAIELLERRYNNFDEKNNFEETAPSNIKETPQGNINTSFKKSANLNDGVVDKVVAKEKDGTPIRVYINFDKLKGKLIDYSGKYLFKAMGGRFFVLARVGAFHIPFYISQNGTSGKVAGNWYPFFGINKVGWLVKGKISEGGKMNYSEQIDEVAALLNENFKIPAKYFTEFGTIISGGTPANPDRVLYDINNDVKYESWFISNEHEKNDYPETENEFVANRTGIDPDKVVNDGKGSVEAWINDIVKLTEEGIKLQVESNEVKAAEKAYEKAQRALAKAEEEFGGAKDVQQSMFADQGAQGRLFGDSRETIKSVLDPLRQKVAEAKAALDKARAKAKTEENAKGGQQSLFQKGVKRLSPITRQRFNALLENLEKAIGGVYGGMQSEAAFRAILKKIPGGKELVSKGGKLYGYVKDGKIYLNEGTINGNTPIHEYAHVWVAIMRRVRPDVLRKGYELIKKSKYLEKILNKSGYEEEAAEYRSGNEEAILEEALVTAIGDQGEQIVNRALKKQFRDWVKDFWNAVKFIFGGTITQLSPEKLQNLSLNAFTTLVAGQLAAGIEVKEQNPFYDSNPGAVFNNILGAFAKRPPSETIQDVPYTELKQVEGGKLLAPNGKPSNLTPEQYRLVRTPEFKAWFGDWEAAASVVYHGTDKVKPFAGDVIGDIGIHFGTKKAAEDRLDSLQLEGGSVTPYKLVLNNPIRIRDVGAWADFSAVADELLKKGIITQEEYNTAEKFAKTQKFYEREHKVLVDILKTKGYDGFVYKNDSEDPGNDSYIVFDTNQIKEASDIVANVSKVVDENGEPLVVYHGTNNKFTEFDRTKGTRNSGLREFGDFFTSNIQTAKLYGNETYPVFLNIRTPFEHDANGKDSAAWGDMKLNIGYKVIDGSRGYLLEAISGKNNAYESPFDGLIIKNMADIDGNGLNVDRFVGTTAMTLSPNQIKLADGTNTTFDPNTNDIRKQIEIVDDTKVAVDGKIVYHGDSPRDAKAFINRKYPESAYDEKTGAFKTRNGELIGYRYDTEMVARERFDFSKLKKIGAGSDRDVYDLGDGKVLKVAKTARGLEQNMHEGNYDLTGITPKQYEGGLNYVVVQSVPKAKKSDVVTTYDWDSGEEIGTATMDQMLNDLSDISQLDFDKHTTETHMVLGKYGFSYLLSYDMLWGDFLRLANWGYDKATQTPIHIDGGTFGGIRMIRDYMGKKNLSDPDFRKIYYESKRLKKLYGDTDKKTMYQIELDQAKNRVKEAWQQMSLFGVRANQWDQATNMRMLINAVVDLAIKQGAKSMEDLKRIFNEFVDNKKDSLKLRKLRDEALASADKVLRAYESAPNDDPSIMAMLAEEKDSIEGAIIRLQGILDNMDIVKNPVRAGRIKKFIDHLDLRRRADQAQTEVVMDVGKIKSKDDFQNAFNAELSNYRTNFSVFGVYDPTGIYEDRVPMAGKEDWKIDPVAAVMHANQVLQKWHGVYRAKGLGKDIRFIEMITAAIRNDPENLAMHTIGRAALDFVDYLEAIGEPKTTRAYYESLKTMVSAVMSGELGHRVSAAMIMRKHDNKVFWELARTESDKLEQVKTDVAVQKMSDTDKDVEAHDDLLEFAESFKDAKKEMRKAQRPNEKHKGNAKKANIDVSAMNNKATSIKELLKDC